MRRGGESCPGIFDFDHTRFLINSTAAADTTCGRINQGF